MPVSFRFRPEWLEDSGDFTWRSALALVSACKAAYLPAGHAADLATNQWSMQPEPFEVGDSQGLILEDGRVLVVAFRGTDSTADWLGNLQITPRKVPEFNGSVHNGFLDAYERVAPIVENAVARLNNRSLWFTGHSLGGALALVAALTHKDQPITGLMTFGQPRMLGRRPAELVNARFGRKFQRFVNRNDIVTRVPPGYRHAGQLRRFTGMDSAFGGIEEFAPEAVEQEEISEMSEAEFAEMQEQIDAVRDQVEGFDPGAFEGVESEDFDVNSDEMLDASVEGLIPGVSAHRIDAYLAEVNARAATETSLLGVHETFQERRNVQFSMESTIVEDPFAFDEGDFFEAEFEESAPGDDAPGPTPAPADPEASYLVRLSTHAWTPPADVTLRSMIGNIASILTTPARAAALAGDIEVVSVEASREAGVEEVDVSVPHVKGTAVHTRPDMSEMGDGAMVGIIDTGIDILHEAFNDADGNSRVVAVWLQRDPRGPSPKDVDPAAFSQDYGTLYLAKDIAEFRRLHKEASAAPPRGLRDEFSGHGTHVAGIAAGRAFADVGNGMAPEAKIVVVSAHTSSDPTNPAEPRSLGYSASHVDALAFLKTVSMGGTEVMDTPHPMAINVSLGMNAGAHDGKTTLEAAFDGITGGGRDPGLVIVKSAGNERAHAGHASVQAALGAVVDIEWETDANSRKRDYLEAWFEPGDDIEFTLFNPMNSQIGPVNFSSPVSEVEVDGNFYRLALSEGHSDNGHNRLAISVERRTNDIIDGPWRLQLLGNHLVSRDGIVHVWAERVRFRSIKFLNPDRKMTLSVPGTAQSIVTVGACGSTMPMRLLNMSSLGLTRDGRPKPELCAPGEMIVAAQAGANTDAAIRKSGTSMAAPHVTGAAALVFSARAKKGLPQVNAVQLQQKLRLTTQNFSPLHNPGFGSGILDAEKLVEELTKVAGGA